MGGQESYYGFLSVRGLRTQMGKQAVRIRLHYPVNGITAVISTFSILLDYIVDLSLKL